MTLRFRPHFFLYHLLWNMLYTWMMNSSFFILSLQFPIKEILCSLQTSPVLITQSHRAKGWGSPHQGPSATFCHELVLGPSAVLFAGGGCVYYFCLGMTAGMESWGSWTELGCCWQLGAWEELAHVHSQYSTSCPKWEEKPLSPVPERKSLRILAIWAPLPKE